MTKKSIQKPGTIAPLTARATTGSEAIDGREDVVALWLNKKVMQRIEEGRTRLIDMATDLPFDGVLRGRVAPVKEDVLAQAEPLAQVIQQFTPAGLVVSIDPSYIRERLALIRLLGDFEKAAENFLGLIRRTRAVMAAHLEKALRAAYLTASESAATVPALARALSPLAPALSGAAKKDKK